MIAAALVVLPWALVWAVAPHHHLDSTVVTILVAVTNLQEAAIKLDSLTPH